MLFSFMAARIKNDKGMAAGIPAAFSCSAAACSRSLLYDSFIISSSVLPSVLHTPVCQEAQTYSSYNFPHPAD